MIIHNISPIIQQRIFKDISAAICLHRKCMPWRKQRWTIPLPGRCHRRNGTGPAIHGAEPVNDNLQELRTAVAEKIHPGSGKVRVMVWWKMAAAAIVVIVAGLFIWNSYFDPAQLLHRTAAKGSHCSIAGKNTLIPEVPLTDSSPNAVAPATTEEGLPSTFSTARCRQ